MYSTIGLFIILLVGVSVAQPVDESANAETRNTAESIWRGTPVDGLVQQYQDECLQHPDSGACVKVQVLSFVNEVLGGEVFKTAGGSVAIVANENEGTDHKVESVGRSSDIGFLDQLESYVKKHDVIVKTPSVSFLPGATIEFSPRNLDQDELSMNIRLLPHDESSATESRGRKSKLKRILVPILVFVLLKAMTLIPLAIGVLGLKAWNALQLSFISFLVSISLAIFQFCKKLATESAHPIATHLPFDASHYAAARNLIVSPEQSANLIALPGSPATYANAQDLVYRGWEQNLS